MQETVKYTRKRRTNKERDEINTALIDLMLKAASKGKPLTFDKIRTVFKKYNSSDATIRRELDLLGITYNGHGYVLKDCIKAQKTTAQLAELIMSFDIYEPIKYSDYEQQYFKSLELHQIYLRLKPKKNTDEILKLKHLLHQYLNQVHTLYLQKECETYPLEDYFFDITHSNKTVCFSFSNESSMITFYRLLRELTQYHPKKKITSIKLFHIIPE